MKSAFFPRTYNTASFTWYLIPQWSIGSLISTRFVSSSQCGSSYVTSSLSSGTSSDFSAVCRPSAASFAPPRFFGPSRASSSVASSATDDDPSATTRSSASRSPLVSTVAGESLATRRL